MGGWFQRGGVSGACPPAQQHFQPLFLGAARPTGCLPSSLLCRAGSHAPGEAARPTGCLRSSLLCHAGSHVPGEPCQGSQPPCMHGFGQQLDHQTGRRRSAISGCSGRREPVIRVPGDAAPERISAWSRHRLLPCPHLGAGLWFLRFLRSPGPIRDPLIDPDHLQRPCLPTPSLWGQGFNTRPCGDREPPSGQDGPFFR